MRPTASRWRLGLVAMVLAGVVACSSGTTDEAESSTEAEPRPEVEAADEVTFPGDEWATVEPAAAGFDPAAVGRLDAAAEATGDDPVDYARTHLFEPIGMTQSTLSTDAAGNALMFSGLQTTCLDLARFGYLMLHDGRWDGEQVVSSDYVEQATGRSSTELNAAYGLLWWVNREGPIAGPALATTGADDGRVATGQLVPEAPDDAFWALGFQNQIVAVVPSEGVVAVRMGRPPPPEAGFTQSELTVGVLDALVDP